ncbi:MED6-domain-containing protein [Testicularia cyperi]|uniref:Mediator of RNA polymerase II transcription subunit 6 n=1 Tax=Testicularia cyperi TaxID=1882483 RepID=A0A317XKF4_9BASI|nr:MED6-domain-containing protein [Testicularia cyperi]
MSAPGAAGSAAAETPNLLHVQFKNPEFLAYLSHLQSQGITGATQDGAPSAPPTVKYDPANPLNEHNVMAYFATSPFFDRRSNNEQIRMQNIANGTQNLLTGPPPGAKPEHEELKRFTGLEFVLVHAKPPSCFVIQKRWRTSPTETTPLAAYYVINDSIYQAPDLYSILATRLQSTVHGLKTSLSTQRAARPAFNPRRGHHGRFIVPDPTTAADTDNSSDEDEDEGDDNDDPTQPLQRSRGISEPQTETDLDVKRVRLSDQS